MITAKAKVKNLAIGVVTFRDFQDPFVVAYNHRLMTVVTGPGASSVQTVLSNIGAGE